MAGRLRGQRCQTRRRSEFGRVRFMGSWGGKCASDGLNWATATVTRLIQLVLCWSHVCDSPGRL